MAKKKYKAPPQEYTQSTEEPICPHCGHENTSPWGMTEDDDPYIQQEIMECENCDESFVVEMEVTISHSTSKA